MYVLMSVVIQPSWLQNPIKLIIIIIITVHRMMTLGREGSGPPPRCPL